jgi:hypothetical protein
VALEALFTDTLGGRSILLVDAEATRTRVEAEFLALAIARRKIPLSSRFRGTVQKHTS